MEHMDLIRRNFDDGYISLADQIILSEETPQKDNVYLWTATKADDREDLIKAMEKEIKYSTTEDVWEILPKSSLPTSAHIIRLMWSFKFKREPFREHIKRGTSKIF